MINLPLASHHINPPESSAPTRKLFREIPDLPDEYLLVIDNSSLEVWKLCSYAARNYLVLHREGHARNAALVFGGAVHLGLESLYRGESLNAAQARAVKYFTDNPVPPGDYRTAAVASEVLQHYELRARQPDYAWQILSDSSGPLIERAFELPFAVFEVDAEISVPEWETPRYVKRIHVAWSGRIDVVTCANERNRVTDNKTTSIGSDDFIQSFQLSSQTRGYVWAGQQIWPELSISGFCLNALWLKRPAKGSTSWNGSLVDKGPRGGDPALQLFRKYFDYHPSAIEQWRRDTVAHIEDFITCLIRNHFPTNDRSCFNKYGRCQFHDACTMFADPANADGAELARVRFLNSSAYKAVTWNPTHERD